MVTTLSPNVRATPTRPMPTCGKVAAITALPHPANVSQNVPMSSAAYFRASIGCLRELLLLGYPRAKIGPKSSEILNGDRFLETISPDLRGRPRDGNSAWKVDIWSFV